MDTKPDMILWLCDSHSVYLPQDFATSFKCRELNTGGVDKETWAELEKGPDAEYYWEAWENVLDNCRVYIDETVYFLHQDGDLWLVPVGMEWSEETDTFKWPSEQESRS